jgi:Toxin SymE, type I toxin-antitoxin system
MFDNKNARRQEGRSMPRERPLRKFTVTTRSSWPTYRQVPQIRMCGAWLAQAGFTPGTFLDVEVSEGMLVIRYARFAGDPDPEIVRKAIKDLQREYRRRFPKRRSKG